MLRKKRLNNDKLYNSNAGFTLVELMVVIVMLAIVAGLTVFGILKWQDWSRFNQENEYAQTLFVAAQNQLSEYAANGRLEELQASLAGLEEGGSIYDLDVQPGDQIYCPLPSYGLNLTSGITGIIGEDGNAYDLSKVFPESNEKADAEKYRDEIVSLRAEAGEYSIYLEDPTKYKEINPEAFWVFELLGAYVYDTSILDGGDQGSTAICVEITPRDGQVFSVLYSDRNTKFIYKGFSDANGSEEESFVSDITNRTESYRRPRMVGYYGVDTLYASTVNATIRPSIARVKLHNEDTFYLTAKLSSKYKSLTQRMTYEIDLDSSKDVTAKKLSLVLDGSKLRNEDFADTIMCPVNRYDETGKKIELGEMPILAWVESDSSIHVVYDAADVQATTYLYENELDYIRASAVTEDDKENTSFWGTLSFFRFGIDLDNVYATVVAKAAGYVDSRPASNFGNANPAKNQPGGKNPVFASIKKESVAEGTSYAYGVGNARHLYNIRYIEDLSYEDEAKGYKNVTKVAESKFTLSDDIDFGKFQAEGFLYDSYEFFEVGTYPKEFKNYWDEYLLALEKNEFKNALNARIVSLSNVEIDRNNPYRYECEFPAYKVLRENDSLDGNNKTVLGIRISEISNKYLYDIYSVKEDDKKNVKAEDDISVGLFDVCEGSLKDLKLDDFAVRGTNRVGAFCGLNRGSVDNLETLNTHRKSQVIGYKNVGGIMGSQPMLATTNKIKNLTNRATVYGTEAVGGIVGQVRNEENGNKGTVLIDKCNNKGPVSGELSDKLVGVLVVGQDNKSRAVDDEARKEKTRYIGGIVGYCYNSNTGNAKDIMIRDCVSSLQYTSNELTAILGNSKKLDERLVGDYVGGIVGYNYYGTILNCSAQAEKGVEGCIFGYKYVGGIVGYNIGPASGIDGSNTLGGKGINANNVVGCYYVGGITGANSCAKNTVTLADNSVVTLESNDPEYLSENNYILETDPTVSLDIKIDNWTNKGVVIATKEYAGGITGYNSGWIYRCQSEVNFTAVDNYFNTLMTVADLGNYAGGIAGYNNGIVGNTDRNQNDGSKTGAAGKTLSVSVYVNGHNYVGGVVGYNDVDAIVEDYQVSGGYVRGYDNKISDDKKSSFVGGYAGFNAAIDLLMDLEGEENVARFIRSNPNKVEGTYFVGGTIGGNIINTFGFDDGTKDDVTPNIPSIEELQTGDEKPLVVYVEDKNNGNGTFDIVIKNSSAYDIKNWQLILSGISRGEIKNIRNVFADVIDIEEQDDRLVLSFSESRVLGSDEVRISIKANHKDDKAKIVASVKNIAGTVVERTNSDSPIPQKGTKNILAQYKTDNFLGTLKGDEFVGGYIGYNIFIDNDDKETWVTEFENGDKNAIYVLQNKILAGFTDIAKTDEEGNDITLLANKNILDDLNNSLGIALKESDGTITISGKEAESARTEFGSIEAKVYVGGVLGYNDAKTNMLITDVVNATPVIATQAVKYKEEQPIVDWLGNILRDENGNIRVRDINYTGKEYEYEYSYAGGIIGKVGKLTIIDDCHNSFSGTVKTEGTYTGGLCEVNEGEIRNCETSNLGNGVDNYLGGLCGLNKFDGEIHNCSLSKKTINGGNVVGGIAAENFGIIRNIIIEEPRINAYGAGDDSKDGVAGVLAAVNGDKGRIELENNLNNIVVKSGGRYVGAVAGISEGTIENKKTTKDDLDLLGELGIGDNLEISGSIEGYYDVGALVGLNKDRDETHIVNNYTNKATVIASNGNAGGIIGENASNNTIAYCVNDAIVSATIGNAGGITSVNYGIIRNSFDYKAVSAPKGMCGGIVACNGDINNSAAVIEDCYVGGSSEVKFVSTGAVGGVAARNYGIIQRNELENVTATNIGTIPHTSIGGVVGDNAITGRIYVNNRTVDGKVIPGVKGCKVIATTNNCNVGGVAGTNDGLITKADNESGYAIIGTEISLDGADYASMGGVTGLNTGTVSYCQVDAVINGYLGTETTGYGGVAGFNGYSSKELYNTGKQNHSSDSNYRAQIIDCTFDGNMRADGSAGNPANVGGMTGVNGYGGFISRCAIGVRTKDITGENDELITQILSGDFVRYGINEKNWDKSTHAIKADDVDKNAYAYVGGIAGRNYAVITDIDMQTNSVDSSVVVKSFAGSTGGLVGYQYEEAKTCGYKDDNGTEHWVTSSRNMLVEMLSGENDFGVGGIIGYDRAGTDIEYLKNYAHVKNFVNMNVKTGGVIGTLEQHANPIVKVYKCENYGKVEGITQVGGILARSKYCSLNMEDCINYGEVYATAGNVGGLVSRVYDVRDSYFYMTHCINYGFVHAKGSNNVGGLFGNLDTAKNITAYVYDCDNVGIVQRDAASNYPDVKAATAVQSTVGSFIGNGQYGTWYIEQCQNYNSSITANGFVGGNKVIIKLKDCLDDSNTVTNSNKFTPVLGDGFTYSLKNMSASSSMQNVYYLDKLSRLAPGNGELSKDGGAYFSYGRYTDFENFWNGQNYNALNNPSVFLATPKPGNFIQQKNNGKIEFHVAYDREKCEGIKSFNIYFWNGKFDNTASISTTYNVTAMFIDADGKSKEVKKQKQGVTSVMEDNKLVLEVPAGLSKDIRDIIISISNADSFLHGFSYNAIAPDGTEKEYACSYISDKTDTTFHIAEFDRGTLEQERADAIKGYNSNLITSKDSYLDLSPEKYKYIKFTKFLTYDIDINVDCKNETGVGAFVFYPTNDNASATTASGTIKTYYYDYIVTFTDEAGNETEVTGSQADGTAAIGYDSGSDRAMSPVIVEVPDGFNNNIANIKLSFIKGAYNSPSKETLSNSNDFFVNGFGWIPSGSSDVAKMKTNGEDVVFHIGSLLKVGQVYTTKDATSISGGPSIVTLDDLLGLKFNPGEKLQISKHHNDAKYKITFDVNRGEESSGMEAFVFYPGNNDFDANNPSDLSYYEYDVQFVSEDGDISDSVTGVAYGYSRDSENYWKPVEVHVPEGFSKDITRVYFSIGAAKYKKPTDSTTSSNTNNIFLRGFAWIPYGSEEIEPMGVGEYPVTKPSEYESFGLLTRLHCDYSGHDGTANAPYVYTEYDYNNGFNMDVNDPVHDNYYSDITHYNPADSTDTAEHFRVNVYNDIHPKFTTFVKMQHVVERKLATPVPVIEDKNSMYKVSWTAIPGAYEYEIMYIVKDSAGNLVKASDVISLGGGTTSYVMPINHEEWLGCDVSFKVKAVNAYRYSETDESKKYMYDSDWGTASITNRTALPEPIVHLELTANNKTVAVLENREEYLLDSGEYIDCDVETTFTDEKENDKVIFHINVADSGISDTSIYLKNHALKTDYKMYSRAMPNETTMDFYTESHQYYQRGRLIDNEKLQTEAQYPGGTTNNYVDFRGFYGTEADQMTYSVFYSVDTNDARDGYVKADIIAYDDELGMNVSYSSMETHTAASSGAAYFTATLSDLPQEWFAEDFKEEIIARSYMEASQYRYMYYGHPIATDIVLDGTTEEKLATLKDIMDPYYLVDDGDMICQENVSILDEDNKLKPGYTLQIKYDADGNKIYDIFYNATIELAEKDAVDKANYVYSNFAVAYKQYVSKKNVVEIDDSGSTKLSISKNYADINTYDFQETFMTRNYRNGSLGADTWPATNTNLNVRMQEIQPAPIIDEDYVEEQIDGHKSYTFTFDEYYKDVTCMAKGGKTDYYNSNADSNITCAGAEIAPTWAAFIQKSDFENANTATKLRIMNAYYSTYSKAEYKVELIGTTLDGQEAVIEAKEVSGAVHIEGKDIIPEPYTVGTTQVNTVYERYNYRVTFTDTDNKWNDYSNLTIRVKRKGTKDNAIKVNGVENNKATSNSMQILSYNDSTFVLPRYSDYKIRIMMKLNSINNPIVGIHQDDGHFVTDNLLYDVSFGAITDTVQLRDLGGYLITAKVINPSNQDDIAKPHYYYVKELDESIEDNDIGIDKPLLESNGVLKEIDKNTEYITTGNVRKTIIDLSDFNTDDEVEISVKAIASTKAENYKDSDDGSVTQTKISMRLVVPDVSKITIDGSGMAETYTEAVDSTVYGEGYYVNYTLGEQSDQNMNLTLDFAAAVFDTKEEAEVEKNKVDSGDDAVGTWNNQALSTIFAKKEPLSAQCKPTQETVQIPLSQVEQYPGQFADKWIKIAAKAKSTSVIASKWTDEDVADASTNYKWIHIPKLKLDDVALTELANTDSYAESIGDGNVLTHSTLEVKENKCVDGYRFTIVGNNIIEEDITAPEEGAGSTKKYTIPVYGVELRKHLEKGEFDGTLDIYVKDISYTKIGSEISQVSGTPTLIDDRLVVNPTNAPVEQVIDFGTVFTGKYGEITTSLMLRYIPSSDANNTNGKIQLILPDISHVGETAVDNFITSQVFVEEYVDDADGAYMAPALASMWSRTKDDSSEPIVYGTKIEPQDISADNYFDYLKERLSN